MMYLRHNRVGYTTAKDVTANGNISSCYYVQEQSLNTRGNLYQIV